MPDSLVNTATGEVVTGDEYVEMILRNYEEANEVYQEAREDQQQRRWRRGSVLTHLGASLVPGGAVVQHHRLRGADLVLVPGTSGPRTPWASGHNVIRRAAFDVK